MSHEWKERKDAKMTKTEELQMTNAQPSANDAVRTLWVLGHRVSKLECAGRVAAVEVATPQGVPGPPPHRHVDCSELFYVTAGTLAVMRDGEWVTLERGEAAE